MKNLVPLFIKEKLKKKEYKGNVNGLVICGDICNFTPIVEDLMDKGKVGAEIIGNLLNDTFGKITEFVYYKNGFISSFSGDAFTAIFPDKGIGDVNDIIPYIISLIKNVKVNDIDIKLKIGYSEGNIEWGIVGDDSKMYYFRGKAIEEAWNNQKILDYKNINLSNYKLDVDADKNINKIFYPSYLNELNIKGEFRDVVTLFVKLPTDIDYNSLNKIYNSAIEIVKNSGGYFNKIEFNDKGSIFLIIYGAPIATEDMIDDAVESALHISRIDEKITVGMDIGTTYAGFIGSDIWSEYTVIGDSVNTSARIAVKFKEGVFVSGEIEKQLKAFSFSFIDKVNVKGKRKIIDIYKIERKKGVLFDYSTPFTGRNKEIMDILNNIKKGNKWIFIYGEGGTGKTRLVYEIAKKENKEVVFLYSDNIIKDSLYPVKQFFSYITGNEISDFQQGNIDKIYDFLKEIDLYEDRYVLFIRYLFHLKDIGFVENLPPDRRKEGLFGILKDILQRYFKYKDGFLVFDDAMWMDEDTIEFIKYLSHFDLNFSMFVLYREKKDFIDEIKNYINPFILNMDNFSKDGIKDYANKFFETNISEKMCNFLYDKTGGNPLFLEQFLLHLKENNLIEIKNDLVYHSGKEEDIPSSLSRLIVSRLDKLSPDVKDGVQRASVIGKEFESDILSDLIDRGDVKEILQEGERKKILTIISKKLSSFRHSMLYEAAYNMQLKERLKELHEKVGLLYERKYKDLSPFYEILFHHFNKAGNEKKSLHYLALTAFASVDQFSNEKGIYYLEELLKRDIDDELRCKAYYYYGEVMRRIGNYDKAVEYYDKSYSIGIDRCEYALKSFHQKGKVYWEKGEYDKSLEIYEKVKRIYEGRNDNNGIAETIRDIGLVYYLRGDYKRSEEELNKALSYATNESLKYKIKGNIALTIFRMGKFDEAMETYEEVLEFVRKIKDKVEESAILTRIGNLLTEKDKLDEALPYYLESLKIDREIGNRRNEGINLGNIGNLYMMKGEYEKSLDYLLEALKIDREIGNLDNESIVLGNLGNVYGSMGNYEEALKYYNQALEVDRKIGSKWSEAIDLGNMGELYKKKGDLEGADRCFAQCINVLDSINARYPLSHFLTQRAELLCDMRKKDEALKLAEKSKSIAEELGKDGIVKKCEEIIKRIKKGE